MNFSLLNEGFNSYIIALTLHLVLYMLIPWYTILIIPRIKIVIADFNFRCYLMIFCLSFYKPTKSFIIDFCLLELFLHSNLRN